MARVQSGKEICNEHGVQLLLRGRLKQIRTKVTVFRSSRRQAI